MFDHPHGKTTATKSSPNTLIIQPRCSFHVEQLWASLTFLLGSAKEQGHLHKDHLLLWTYSWACHRQELLLLQDAHAEQDCFSHNWRCKPCKVTMLHAALELTPLQLQACPCGSAPETPVNPASSYLLTQQVSPLADSAAQEYDKSHWLGQDTDPGACWVR